MKLKVKDFWMDSETYQLESFSPIDTLFFALWINVRIGSELDLGTNDYQIFVCTPEWLKKACQAEKAIWGRHMLIVSSYDLDLIKEKINQYVESCEGKDFLEIANKIARIAAWEYEDYEM